MTDLLVQIGVSNLCISLALAIAAWAVQRTGKRPAVAHLLWLLVLAKLVTPPILTVPMLDVSDSSPTIMAEALADHSGLAAGSVAATDLDVGAATAPGADALSIVMAPSFFDRAKTGLVLLWLLGSGCVLGWSLLRIYRFNLRLKMASKPAPPELQRMASTIAQRLGLRKTPTICTTSAHLSPMVWWIGGKVRIVIPASLPREMGAGQLRWILAHELGHVRRRDHLVRWLEWLACVGFWWNPVAWWARRNLRANEEICCDALVLESLKPNPHSYANSLLAVVEFLASPALRPPAMASEINSGGFLERRFEMITSSDPTRRTPRLLHAFILLFAVCMLPLGLAHAQSPDMDALSKRLRAAVRAGELTPEQAKTMLDALRKQSGAKKEQGAEAREYLIKVRKELAAAVEAGKISKEDAVKRFQGAEKAVRERMAAGRLRKEVREEQDPGSERAKKYLEQVRKDLGEAVRAGKISREDAGKRYEEAAKAVKERMAQVKQEKGEPKKRITREEYAKIEAELRRAVEAGEVSGEDARKRLQGVREWMAQQGKQERGEQRRRMTREDFRRGAAEIKKAVAEGKVSEEDARARLEAMRKAMAEQGEQDGGEERRDLRAEYAAFEKRIKAAVKAGEMTEEEAKKKLEGFRKRLGALKERGR